MHATGAFNTKVWQGFSFTSGLLQEATSPVTQQMLAAAQLRTEYVVAEFHALQKLAHIEQQEFDSKINKLTKAREDLQKATEEQGKVRCQVILASLGLFFCVLQVFAVFVFGYAITHVISCADHRTDYRFTFSSTTTTPAQDRLFVVTEYPCTEQTTLSGAYNTSVGVS